MAARGAPKVDWFLRGRALIHHLADVFCFSPVLFTEEFERANNGETIDSQCLLVASQWHDTGRHSISVPRRLCEEAAAIDDLPAVPLAPCRALEILLPPSAIVEPTQGGSASSAYVYAFEEQLFVAVMYPLTLMGFALKKQNERWYAAEPITRAGHTGSITLLVKVIAAVHTIMRMVDEKFPPECLMRAGRPVVNSHRIPTLVESERRMIPDNTRDEIEPRLVKLTTQLAQTLEKGDLLYEPIRFGEGRTKYNALRVIAVDGGESVRVMRADGQDVKPRRIRVQQLMIEKKDDEPMTQPKSIKLAAVPNSEPPARASALPPERELFEGMLAAVEQEIEALNAENDRLIKQLEERDTVNRRRIERLEADLARARKDYEDDRALVSMEADDVAERLAYKVARRDWLRAMPGK